MVDPAVVVVGVSSDSVPDESRWQNLDVVRVSVVQRVVRRDDRQLVRFGPA